MSKGPTYSTPVPHGHGGDSEIFYRNVSEKVAIVIMILMRSLIVRKCKSRRIVQ